MVEQMLTSTNIKMKRDVPRTEFYEDMMEINELSEKVLSKAKITSYSTNYTEFRREKSTIRTINALLKDLDEQIQETEIICDTESRNETRKPINISNVQHYREGKLNLLTNEQKSKLKIAFLENETPTSADMKRYSKELALSYQKIKQWYKNQRRKERNIDRIDCKKFIKTDCEN